MSRCKNCGTEISDKKKSGLCRLCWRREHTEKNRDKIRKQHTINYTNNREKRLKQSKEWQKKNLKRVIEQHKGYYRDNPQRWQTRTKTQQLYGYLMNGAVCEFCGMENNLQFHHTTEPYEVDKFKIVCPDCHRKIHKELAVFDKQEVNK